MNQAQLLINGTLTKAKGDKTFERMDPIHETVATVAAAAQPEDVTAALEAAQQAFPAWSAVGPNERRRLLLKAAELMQERCDDFVALATRETGSTSAWYRFNVTLAAQILREAAALTTQIQGALIPSDLPGNLSMAKRVPCGVVVSMAPWNAPVILATRAVAMPLACGNTVVLKASERCPATHLLIGEILDQAGLPPGVINIISHAPEDAPQVVAQLIAHPAVKRVNFTGSTKVGRQIALLAAQHLKPVLLELGGKAPAIICADADLDQAVAGVVFGAFFNQGQICMSTERLIVHHEIASAFLDKLVAKIKIITAQATEQSGVNFGHLESIDAAKRIQALVEDAQAKGAKLPVPLQVDGAFMAPLVVQGITPEMRLYAEESFGPVVTMTTYEQTKEAIALANDSPYGLSASVYSQDINQALFIADQIDSGICHINGPTVHDEAQAPFGGTKESGYGRFGGRAAIEAFTELRWVTVQTTPRTFPL